MLPTLLRPLTAVRHRAVFSWGAFGFETLGGYVVAWPVPEVFENMLGRTLQAVQERVRELGGCVVPDERDQLWLTSRGR